jgi:hypothetical protein
MLALAVLATGCGTSPAAASGESVLLATLSPGSAHVGTEVVIHGSGFTTTGNTVRFGAQDALQQMPAEPGIIPNLSSADGQTLSFWVPRVWLPACSYSGPCPIANIPTAPGPYRVSVSNARGTSNSLNFAVAP